MTAKQYKELSIKEFTKAAEVYESDHAGVYNLCKKDYPDVLAELEKEPFTDQLDCGCGTAPMISLLYEKYPEKHYTGIDLTPKMIEAAKAKQLKGVEFIVGDCENLPFAENSFDAVICCESFHHYPNPQDFFDSVYRVLLPGGRFVLRDMTMETAPVRWFCNNVEMPLAHLAGKGDVRIYGREDIQKLCDRSGLHLESYEKRGFCRLHCVIADGKEVEELCDNYRFLRETSFFEEMKKYTAAGKIGDLFFRKFNDRLAVYRFCK